MPKVKVYVTTGDPPTRRVYDIVWVEEPDASSHSAYIWTVYDRLTGEHVGIPKTKDRIYG